MTASPAEVGDVLDRDARCIRGMVDDGGMHAIRSPGKIEITFPLKELRGGVWVEWPVELSLFVMRRLRQNPFRYAGKGAARKPVDDAAIAELESRG